MKPWLRNTRLAFAAALLASAAYAKKENPLERSSPVPATEPIPVIDFFRPRLFQSPTLSPGGTHFTAIVSSNQDRNDALVYEFATKKFERLTGGKDMDVTGCRWLNDRRFLFHLLKEKKYAYGLFAADVGKLERAIPIERFNVIQTIGVPRDEPLKPIIWIRKSATNQGADGGVVQIDAERTFNQTGTTEANASVINSFPSLKGGDPVGYLADQAGRLAFGFTSKDGIATLHRLAGEKWEKCPVDLDTIAIVSAGEKPGELLVLGPRPAPDKTRPLQRLDAASGQLGEIIYQDDTYDLSNLSLYRDREGVIRGLRYNQKMPKTVWFDADYAALQVALEKALPDLAVSILGSDRAQKQFFVSARSDRMPTRYFHFNLDKVALTPVASTAPWIDPARQLPMKGLSFKTRDSVQLDGYVTLPSGASKENPAPLVVLAHGGPRIRDTWGWDAEAQFLASRGYAVFQPNYRGSPGYGSRYPEEDDWAFRKMHDDVTDGVKALLRTGLIDRDRIAIMGGSFGGYLALCGATYEPGFYRCAITIAGIFDWEKVMKEARAGDDLPVRYGSLRRHLGDPKTDQEKFDAISPLRHVDQIRIPIYVAHGGDDRVADIAQSKRLIEALKKFGVPFEKQFEREEGHGFQQLENKVELYTAIEAFLAKNLAPRPATTTAAAPAAP